MRHRQLADHLKTQLTEAKEQLVEVTVAAKAQTETAAQHAEILAKVRTFDGLMDLQVNERLSWQYSVFTKWCNLVRKE